ncbi:MAG: hypothetical protein HY290_14815 [Planctomycetia bacterium]|nr:hypothetical protein [Planctomycetia bacterium]
MTNLGIRLVVAGTGLFLALEGTAEAAKGVKKVAPANGAPRTVSGVVLNVAHRNGSGSFHLRTAQHHKKRGVVNAGAPVANANAQFHSHQFHVTAATRFAHQNGTPASFAALHRGERVRVQATGQQASAVQILSNHRAPGSFARNRTRVYAPHFYQARRHLHPPVIRRKR